MIAASTPGLPRRLPRLLPLAAGLLLCLALNLLACFPGIPTADSDKQYAEALSGAYTDWHPPVMARLWSMLRLAGPGNGPLFTAHILVYWLGFGLLAFTLRRLERPRSAWAMLACGLLPPFSGLNAYLLKDIGLAVCLLAAFAVLFCYRAREKKLPLAPALLAGLLLAYGMLVRANGVFAGASLLLYWLRPSLFRQPGRGGAALALVAGLAIPASGFINHTLLKAEATHPVRSLEIFDLAGIAHDAHDASVFWPGPFTIELVDACYNPALWDRLGQQECHVFWDSPSPGQGRHWAAAILHHPLAYLEHRLRHFNAEMEFIAPRHSADEVVKRHVVYGDPLPAFTLTPLQQAGDYLAHNPLFSPAFFLVLGLCLLGLAWTLPGFPPVKTAVLCLLASALPYMGAYAIVGVASDVRYQYWPMMAIAVAGVLYCSLENPLRSTRPRQLRLVALILGLALMSITMAWQIEGNALNPG